MTSISTYIIDLPEGSLQTKVQELFTYYQMEKTYNHSLEVALEAQRLAPRFGLDKGQAFIAGLLHDTGGVIPNDVRVELALGLGIKVFEEEKQLPLLLHQQFSKVLTAQLFAIHDEEILAAVSSHTTLRPEASDLDKLIFIADKIKWDRNHRAPYLESVEEKIQTSLDGACLAYLDWAFKTGMPVVHPYTKLAYEELQSKI